MVSRSERVTISDKALRLVIREYTREAGVRGLERRIADLCRKAALKVAEGYEGKIRIDERRVRAWLGPRRYSGDARNGAPPTRASRRGSRTRLPAATCCSSRRRRTRARAG